MPGKLSQAGSFANENPFLRSLGNPECGAELIKARSLESDSGEQTLARTRTLKAKSEVDRIGVSSANRPLLAMGTRPQGEYLLKQ